MFSFKIPNISRLQLLMLLICIHLLVKIRSDMEKTDNIQHLAFIAIPSVELTPILLSVYICQWPSSGVIVKLFLYL